MVISTINHSWATCEATERYLGFTREHLFSVSVEVTRSTRHAQSSHMFPAVSGLGSPAETNVPPIWGSLVAFIHRHPKKKKYIFIIYWLVVLTILKNMKVNGKDYPIYYGKEKMFQTTNQLMSTVD